MSGRKNKINIGFLLLLLLGISLGYALLTQDLTMNGTSKVKGNTWDIHFDNIVLNPNNVTLSTGDSAATINVNDDTLVEYTVTLNVPGDFYEFTVDAVNEGTVDGMIGEIITKLNGVAISNENLLPDYLDYTFSYIDGVELAPNHLLAAGDSETFKVRVEFKRDIENSELPTTDQTNTFTFEVGYVQTDENAIVKPLGRLFILPLGKTGTTLVMGDEVCINGATMECFEFIRYDGSDAVLLAKYNLNIGEYARGGSETFIQDSQIPGNEHYGEIVYYNYHEPAYWLENDQLKAKYGTCDEDEDIYDPDYAAAPDFSTACNYTDNCDYTPGFTINYYAKHYKDILTGTGYEAPIKKARYLTLADILASSIGSTCSPYYGRYRCPAPPFLYRTIFWMGAGSTDNSQVYVCRGSNNEISMSVDYPDNEYGVRPIIIIETDDLA